MYRSGRPLLGISESGNSGENACCSRYFFVIITIRAADKTLQNGLQEGGFY